MAAFLRVINVLENLRQAEELLGTVQDRRTSRERGAVLLERARAENEDALQVLFGGGLHAEALPVLQEADALLASALDAGDARRREYARQALDRQRAVRALIVSR